MGNGYHIQIREDGADEWVTVEPKDPDSLQTTVDQLNPGTK